MSIELRIGALLRQSYQEVAKMINHKIVQLEYDDIRSTHFPVLQPIFFCPSGMTSSELASMAGITKQSMGEMVKYLEERGYVGKTKNVSDARAWLIVLTPKGEELMNKIYKVVTQLDEQFEEQFGRERFQNLRVLLMEFNQVLQNMNSK